MRPSTLCAALAAASLFARAAPAQTDAHELPPPETKPQKPQGLIVPVSIVGGIRAGGALNAGKNAPDSASNPNGAIAGIDLALEIGSIVLDHFYGGFIFGGTFFVSPQDTTSDVKSVLAATELGYLTNTHGVGGFFGLGVGYRAMLVSDAVGNANKFDGPEGLATVGLYLRPGSLVSLMPRLDFGVGPSGDGNAHAIFVLSISAWIGGQVWGAKRHHP
jgi:hypothetical protein